MKKDKAKAVTYLPGGRLERTLFEINQKKAARRWRYKALKLGLVVLIFIFIGICAVIYRMEQNTLWLTHNFPFN